MKTITSQNGLRADSPQTPTAPQGLPATDGADQPFPPELRALEAAIFELDAPAAELAQALLACDIENTADDDLKALLSPIGNARLVALLEHFEQLVNAPIAAEGAVSPCR